MTRVFTGTTVRPAALGSWQRLTLIELANGERAQTRHCAKFSAGRSGRDANDDIARPSQTRSAGSPVARSAAASESNRRTAHRAYIIDQSSVTARSGSWQR